MNPTHLLLCDHDHRYIRSLSRFQSIFHIRNGIFRPIDRLKHTHPKATLQFTHPSREYTARIARQYGWKAVEFDSRAKTPQDLTMDTQDLEYCGFVEKKLAQNIEADLAGQWLASRKEPLHSASILRSYCQGDVKDLHICKSVLLGPGMLFDTRNGPIVLQKNVRISPFTFLQGPLVVGADSHLDSARMSNGVVGQGCRMSGEIKDCLIGDFTNKHHDGFIGHSLIGNWVNLAAMTTISDLKNTYGEISISVPTSMPPSAANKQTESQQSKTAPATEIVTSTPHHRGLIPTGKTKFGAIIGDWTRTAIGTMITCGSNIDAGCHLFTTNQSGQHGHGHGHGHGQSGTSDQQKNPSPPMIQGYVPPLSWGNQPNLLYIVEKFKATAQKIAARRGQTLPQNFTEILHSLQQERKN